MAVAENMRQSLEPLADEMVVPSFYQVHLLEEDHERLGTILPEIEHETRRLLDAELERLNRKATPLTARILQAINTKQLARRYVRAEGNWAIQYREVPPEKLEPGSVEVISDLRMLPDSYPVPLAIRLRDDKSLAVQFQVTDGSWGYSGEAARLPSGLYVAASEGIADILGELEELINYPDVRESDLQKFFERYPDLLKGTDFSSVIPQALITSREGNLWRADFILKPVEQGEFCRVLELKLPQAPLVRGDKNGHPQFYAQLLAAISQLRDYGEAFNSEQVRSRFKELYGVEVYKPELQLIAGRRLELIHSRRLLELQSRNGIHITDWDTQLAKLRRRFGVRY